MSQVRTLMSTDKAHASWCIATLRVYIRPEVKLSYNFMRKLLCALTSEVSLGRVMNRLTLFLDTIF